MAKVSKNAKVAQRAGNKGGGKDFVKVVKPVKDPETGKYSFKEMMVHKDHTDEFFKDVKG